MSKPRRPRRPVTGILLLDKPLGISSNAALQRVKFLYQADKAGHTGSLDPLATGVLPICLGEATKLSGVLLESDKSYCADVQFGVRTSTGDAEGEVVETGPLPDDAALERARSTMVGAVRQVPPMYSALKHEGQRLYELARQGIEIEREAREVFIHELRIDAYDQGRARLQVRCSKGTYIRTLVEDLARAAGSCASLTGLRRTAVVPFDASPTVTLETLEAAVQDGGLAALDALLMAPATGLAHWPQWTVDSTVAAHLAQGRTVRASETHRPGRLAVLNASGGLLGLAEVGEDGSVMPRRWLQAPPVGAPEQVSCD